MSDYDLEPYGDAEYAEENEEHAAAAESVDPVSDYIRARFTAAFLARLDPRTVDPFSMDES